MTTTAQRFVIEITVPVDGGDEETYYVTTAGFRTKPTDTPPNTEIPELIAAGGIGDYGRDLFNGARVMGLTRTAETRVTLINAEGVLDTFARAVGSGRAVCRLGDIGAAYPAGYEVQWVLYVQACPVDFDTAQLILADRSRRFDAPIVTAQFKGTGGLEGTVAAAEKKRLVFGQPGLIPLVLLDPATQLYYVQANATDLNTIGGNSEFGHPFEGGVPVGRGPLYNYSEEMLSTEPDAGEYRLWAGIKPPRINNIILVDEEATQTYTKGPVYLRLVAPPVFELRFGASGLLQNLTSETPRAWRFTDLCNRAGMEDVTPATLAPMGGQTFDFDLGNRLVEGDQTFADVMNDRAAALLGTFGFTADDRFYCAKLQDPEDGADASAFTFTRSNSTDFARAPIPGMEQPVWQISVRAGRAFPAPAASGASAEVTDILGRQEYLVSFTGTCQSIKDRYPEARSIAITIDGHDFATAEAQQAFIDEFGRLHGTQRDVVYLTCTEFTATTRALDLCTKVTLLIDRFGYDAGEPMRIISTKRIGGGRQIRFGLWGRNSGYGTWELGGGSYPAGSGDPGGSWGGPIPPDSAPTATTLRDLIDPFEGAYIGAILTAGLVDPAMDDMGGTYIGSIAAPSGDPDFASVALLLHGDGTDGSLTITDSSSYADHKTGVSGEVEIDTAQSKWGGASIKSIAATFTGVTWSSSRFNRSSGQAYTIELWFRASASPGYEADILNFSGTIYPIIVWYGDRGGGSVGLQVILSGTTFNPSGITADAWHFLQAVWTTGNVVDCRIDGASIGTVSSAAGWSSSAVSIGLPVVESFDDAWADDLRITVGVARAFAVPTEAFPNS